MKALIAIAIILMLATPTFATEVIDREHFYNKGNPFVVTTVCIDGYKYIVVMRNGAISISPAYEKATQIQECQED